MGSNSNFCKGLLSGVFIICASAAFAGVEISMDKDGLKPIRALEPPVLIYAAERGVQVSDCADSTSKNGPLAQAVTAALKRPNATLAEFFDALHSGLRATRAWSQTPQIVASRPINTPLVKNQGKAAALAIGMDKYQSLTPLRCSAQDAEIVAKESAEIGFRSKTITNADLATTKVAMKDFLDQLGPDDTAIIYFAGYAFQANNDDYLATIDTKATEGPDILISSSLPVSSMLKDLSDSKAAAIVVIFDTQFQKLEARVTSNGASKP